MSLRPRVSVPASLDLAGSRPGTRTVREEGAAVGLSFRIEGRARALVLEERARQGDPPTPGTPRNRRRKPPWVKASPGSHGRWLARES